ncbi:MULTISPECIES: histidinol dehydrogenase [unclassified Frondihabitans]|uniref:histidinol dehydrogenase n=1 Tax=unclassified Frondihabitans TaxID=2626248 RepID=UPI000F4DCC40|nr:MULTISPECIES: histidinol dehydrogenase [unclassified Frondihabitans]RPE74939.1 histidinol dehydrogenase [Frondihabitans sp. PhB153]RPF04183.1 histidinol dehydrogenase [Frondihabitans sp. PhB161]
MMTTTDLRGQTLSPSQLLALVPRAVGDVNDATEAAAALIADVRQHGVSALLDQAERFDRVRPPALRVRQADIDKAVASLDPLVREALVESIARVTASSAAQVPAEQTTHPAPGATIVQRWQPMARAGVYVPGGKAVYPSSVIMNVVPAQVAGVRSIALASPPQAEFEGSVHPTILGAAGLLGITEVYAMGGAGAIGALAYGVDDVDLLPVQVITGPGNNFVAAAKRLVRGVVGIDSEAGATEILVIADASADATLVAVDLISQAEHDEQASAVLVTDSADLGERVVAEVARLAPLTASAERVRTALTGPQSAVVVVDDLTVAAAFSNAYGPEHLEIQTADDDAVLALIDDAGAIFVGSQTPVSLGDYLAGSNHVLPTGGQARFSSGLGAYTFLRPQQIVRYEAEPLAAVAERLVALSRAERLPAHGEAVSARLKRP